MAGKRRLFRIGITGGIGSGKSIACKVFVLMNIPVYDADSRAKFLMENDPEVKELISRNFSEEAYINGALNRKFLSDGVFNDNEKLDILNRIVHPSVKADFENWSKDQAGAEFVIKEAALLFESGSYKDLDRVILVYCPLEIRIRRILMRDKHRNRQEIEKIIEKQMSDSEKKKLADYCITNDDSTLVIPQVLEIHKNLHAEIAFS
jgi:dephospho-CoA kinase